jgi:hypothetical protein
LGRSLAPRTAGPYHRHRASSTRWKRPGSHSNLKTGSCSEHWQVLLRFVSSSRGPQKPRRRRGSRGRLFSSCSCACTLAAQAMSQSIEATHMSVMQGGGVAMRFKRWGIVVPGLILAILLGVTVAFPTAALAGPGSSRHLHAGPAFQARLVATDDAYSTPANTLLSVSAVNGVLINDMPPGFGEAFLNSPPPNAFQFCSTPTAASPNNLKSASAPTTRFLIRPGFSIELFRHMSIPMSQPTCQRIRQPAL